MRQSIHSPDGIAARALGRAIQQRPQRNAAESQRTALQKRAAGLLGVKFG
jgi:hypothetical protein